METTVKVHVSKSWLYRGEHYGPGEVTVPDELVDRLREHDPGFSVVGRDDQSSSPSQAKSDAPDDGSPNHLSGLGLSEKQVDALQEAGITSVDDLNALSDDDLVSIPGIGKSTVAKLRELAGSE